MKKFIQYFTLLLLTPSALFAQDASPTSESTLASFLPLIIIFVIFYFLLIRPQQKKSKEHQEMLTNLKIGNDVCTASGIFGKIKKIKELYLAKAVSVTDAEATVIKDLEGYSGEYRILKIDESRLVKVIIPEGVDTNE